MSSPAKKSGHTAATSPASTPIFGTFRGRAITVAALINYQAGSESPAKDRLAEDLISDMRALGP